MEQDTNIQPLQSDFEQIKKVTEKGKEYWSARELSSALGYSTWQKFNRVLNKALKVAQDRGMDMGEHFNQMVEMVKLGSGTFREVENFHLSRIACLIIAENADNKKPQVQAARIYFKEQTSALELVENQNTSRILIYKTHQGESRVEVIFNGQTFWLTQKRMSDLYGVDVSTINYHLGEIYETGELKEEATIRKFPIVQMEGDREVNRAQLVYNLDAIIAVGYRVNSYQATQFRIWATSVLKEYIIKGFVLDDERLKQGKHFGQDYFDDLLERIREIRTSERRYYQKITDVYAECSADYDPKSETTKLFFKMVQNLMHWAVTHQTAAEIIYNRADADMPHMGLTTWKNAPDGRVQRSDTIVAKNYLSDKEVTALNRISNAFLDMATLNRYNAQQKAGVDEDFGRSAAQMTAALEIAPYYAVCVTPVIHHTMGGLSVNTDTQVLKADGTPIPGLYAAGEVTGGLHGANRLGGNGVADIVVNGRLAGIAAAYYGRLSE